MFSESGGMTDNIKGFLAANSVVAKFAFVMLVLLLFMVLLRFGITIMVFFFSGDRTPHVFDGTILGNTSRRWDQNPNSANSRVILRSNDERGGIEFTWSTWLYIDGDQPQTTCTQTSQSNGTSYLHIFSKGTGKTSAQVSQTSDGIFLPANCPGVYMADNKNSITIVMNTFKHYFETVEVDNMPVNKWVNLIIRVKDKNMDVFINGIITKNIIFESPVKQNYDPVFLHQKNNQQLHFKGRSSNLWYWNYAIGTGTVNNVVQAGPNLTIVEDSGVTQSLGDYLSTKWYFAGQGDMYNPLDESAN